MKKVQIPGTGCAKCETLAANAETAARALADKMKLTPDQIAKACKLGECK
jgi:hypothetical protein